MTEKDEFTKVTVNMPKSHHRKLKAIAALKDMGLSTYIMECIETVVFRKSEEDGLDAENSESDETIKELERMAKVVEN